MEITVNGEALTLDIACDGSVGEVLARADEMLEQAGAVIVGLTVDGKELEAEAYPGIRDLAASQVGVVAIAAEPIAAIKTKALTTLLELLELAKELSALESSPDWKALADGAAEIAQAFSGLFSADELSFVDEFSSLASAAAAGPEVGSSEKRPSRELRAQMSEEADRLTILFKERLSEIQNPAEEMRKAAALYVAEAEELGELSVLLQTGKDERAMKAVLVFIETFNKAIRIIPELKRTGIEVGSLVVDGQALPDFYSSLNEVLRKLSTAFEDKDSVLIGDLAEYEVVPRMKSFFAAMEEALKRA
jgi:hypothetical protein